MAFVDCGTCGLEFEIRIWKLGDALANDRPPYCSRRCANFGVQLGIGHSTQAQMRQSGMTQAMAFHMGALYNSARKNAKKRGIEFELTRADMLALVKRANGHCEVTGIPFELGKRAVAHDRLPWAPSFDRIECARGYRLDNVRLICVSVNLAMNTWGLPALQRISEALASAPTAAPAAPR